MRSHSYLNTAKDILNVYDGSIPLTAWLKNFYKANKKYGSTDRKHISHLCFSIYRLGNSFPDISLEEKLLTALFLCSTDPQLILQELKPEWNEKVSWPLEEKLGYLEATSEIGNIFPFNKHLSPDIDQINYNRSFLIQPSFFLRIRPGKNTNVVEKLQKSDFSYSMLTENGVELPVGTKVEDNLVPDSDIVVQDLNSQKVLELLKEKIGSNNSFTAWDCCAASGGKSILLHDLFVNARITVSDVRESILVNLSKRFAIAGITDYKKFVADISKQPPVSSGLYDVIICDAPCSGSGTWSRTPEQLRFFKEEKIGYYVSLQKKIVVNAGQRLKKKGFFLYITCSVFAEENEDIVRFIRDEIGFQLEEFRYYRGYERKADTLFAALFSAG